MLDASSTMAHPATWKRLLPAWATSVFYRLRHFILVTFTKDLACRADDTGVAIADYAGI